MRIAWGRQGGKFTHVRVADVVWAVEAHEDQLHLDSTNCVTGEEVGLGRVSGRRRQRAGVEDGRIAVAQCLYAADARCVEPRAPRPHGDDRGSLPPRPLGLLRRHAGRHRQLDVRE